MSCLDDNTVAAFIGHSLSPAATVEAERHLETCAACRQLVAALIRGGRDELPRLSTGDTLPSSAPAGVGPIPGGKLGRYVVLDPIGVGGMGVVYAAYDPVLERKVALKLVRGEGAAAALEEVKLRLLREGKSIAQLSHPNIVSVFDMGTSEGHVFVAMELVDGGSLRQWLRATKRSWAEVLEKFRAAGEGLAAAHRAGLVHRDFKPENVLVGSDGRVRVTDFGLASSATTSAIRTTPLDPSPGGTAEPRLTREGAVLGTPAYMAPEQVAGRGADALSDQFSFCVGLWEALFDARPFAPSTGLPSWRPVEPPEDARVPLWLRRAVRKGLSVEPAERYLSMEALLKALGANPARARRFRLRVASGVAMALAAVGASTWWTATRASRLCTGAAAEVAAVWNPTVSGAVGTAFVGTGFEGAAGNWELARRGLDDYWRAWADLYTDACRATRVRGEQSDQLLGLRMACLERRRGEATTLLEVFKHADREVVAKAPEAVEAIRGLYSCSDVEALLAQVSPPGNPAVRAQVEAVSALLTEGKGRLAAGRYQEALARATEAVKLARGVDYRPVLAEALVLQGRLQEQVGDLKAAEQTLLDAISTAEAGKHDAVTAEAATHLMLVLGARQARFAEAHSWGKLAEGAIGRVGGSPALQARLLQTQGLVLYAQGQLVEAIDSHQRAVALFEKLEPDSLTLADALNSLGSALRGGHQSKEALAAFDRAMVILLEKVGPDSDLVATTRNGMANGQMLEGRFDEALALYRQALATFEKRLGPTHFRTVTTLNNIGVVLAEQGRFADALPYFERVLTARQTALAATDAKTADAHANVGMLLVELGRNDEALVHFEKAQGILQGYPLDHFSQAEALLGVAKVHLAKAEAAKAVVPLERVLALCEKKEGFRFDYTRARANFLMGRALFETKKAVEGRALAEQARAALVGFGPERFHRDIAEIDGWLAAHRPIR